MLKSAIDHLVITASSRESGVAFIAGALGVTPSLGGEHPRMGTHNALLRLGDALYLEIISINPSAPAPATPRWFALDRLSPSEPPRFSTWVVRTTDINAVVQRSPLNLGRIETMTRDALRWQITVPPDGTMPLDGMAPSLIQWSTPEHPAETLPDVGCSLLAIEIQHSQARLLETYLGEVGFDGPLTISLPSSGRPSLRARIRTPKGVCVLGDALEES